MNKIKKVSGSKVKLVIVTNIPVPYRNPVYDLLDQYGDINLHVIYCSSSEPDRSWINTNLNYKATFLKQNFFTVLDRYIHINFDVFKILKQLSPEVIITTGYNPTHLF